jgi:hypothetical protein
LNYSTQLIELRTKIWKTKGARFNASRRLQTRKNQSSYLISLYSIYILAIAIYSLTQPTSVAVNFASTLGSLLILIFSVHEGSQGSETKAERHHVCAKQLGALYDEIALFLVTPDVHNFSYSTKKYAEIIDRCPENHEPIDYEVFKVQHSEFNISACKKVLILFEFHGFNILCFIIMIAPFIFFVLWNGKKLAQAFLG